MMEFVIRIAAVISAGAVLSGCVPGSISDGLSESAELQPHTTTGFKLEAIPPARSRIPVSIYSVNDETGQHKPNDNFAEYSKAVTQGGSAILIDVLKNAGGGKWFRVLERVRLPDLLQERKIADARKQQLLTQQAALYTVLPQASAPTSQYELQTRRLAVRKAERQFTALQTRLREAQKKYGEADASDIPKEVHELRDRFVKAKERHEAARLALANGERGKTPPDYNEQRALVRAKRKLALIDTNGQLAVRRRDQLPSIKAARFIVQGSIIAYDSNSTTGGIGARYLGIGGNIEHRRDVVTVGLRLIDVVTGDVRLSVTSTKTVYSVALQGGAFRFVNLDELLELEAGLSRNELASLAVREAMELAVYSMIVEGTRQKIWRFKHHLAGDDVIAEYDTRYTRDGVRRFVRELL